jgi:hypothetical protein
VIVGVRVQRSERVNAYVDLSDERLPGLVRLARSGPNQVVAQ